MAYIDFFTLLSPKEEVPKRRVYLGTHNGVVMLPNMSVDHPQFKLSGGMLPPKCNYIYCDKFDRFYYIDDIITNSNDTYTIVCSSDPLMSFWDTLAGNQFLCDRQEFKYNKLMEDTNVPIELGAQITKKIIGNVGKVITYVLTVTGGAD